MLCLNGSIWTSILDLNTQTLNDCFLKAYLLAPCYLLFAVLNGYQLGWSRDISRYATRSPTSYLRTIDSILFLLVLLDIFCKYFLNLNDNLVQNFDLISSIITDLYKLAAFSLHTLLIFNKQLFTLKYPNSLLISFF